MMPGGWPSQLVWMMTCTSDMSGSASRGIWPSDQIPASTTASVPEKTRKRLLAHHSMIREIILHTSRGIDGKLPADNDASVLLSGHGNLPCAAGAQIDIAFIHAIAFARTLHLGF